MSAKPILIDPMPTPPLKTGRTVAPEPPNDGFPEDKDISKPPPGSDQDSGTEKEGKC